jgi:hypothetical protein
MLMTWILRTGRNTVTGPISELQCRILQIACRSADPSYNTNDAIDPAVLVVLWSWWVFVSVLVLGGRPASAVIFPAWGHSHVYRHPTSKADVGDVWADKAGGTSGGLWGAGLRAFGETVGKKRRDGRSSPCSSRDRFRGPDRAAGQGRNRGQDKWWAPSCPSPLPSAGK